MVSKTKEEIVQENLKTIEEWALQGMSEKEIAECLGMGYSTFRAIKSTNLALLALLKHCAMVKRNIAKSQIEDVELSLFQKAKGYDIEELVPIKVKNNYYDDNGKKCSEEKVVTAKVTKHYPADVQAAKFFLTNKAKRVWRDNPHRVENDKENLKLKKEQMDKGDW